MKAVCEGKESEKNSQRSNSEALFEVGQIRLVLHFACPVMTFLLILLAQMRRGRSSMDEGQWKEGDEGHEEHQHEASLLLMSSISSLVTDHSV